MRYLKQFLIILVFTGLGELLAFVIPLPIPAAIYGLILLLLALCLGVLQPKHIDTTARFLTGLLPLLFVAPTVKILSYWGVIAPNLVPICVIVAVSTLLVFAVAGVVTQLLCRKEENNNGSMV